MNQPRRAAETTEPRIAPGDRRELGLLVWTFSRLAGRRMGTAPPNIFTTLGRHPKLFRAWLYFAGRLMPRGTLPRRESELVILRVAHLRDCAYELSHHEKLGRAAGLTKSDLQAVAIGPSAEGWIERERTLLEAVDELHADGDLRDATWAALRAQLDEKQAIEFLMLAGHYEMLATVLNTLRVDVDARR